MLRFEWPSVLVLLVCVAGCADGSAPRRGSASKTDHAVAAGSVAKSRHLDKSKEFVYALPEGWKSETGSSERHDIVVLPQEDGANRNILIRDQPGSSSFDVLKQKYERDLPKGLKDFQLVASELTTSKNGKELIKIVHTNTAPGIEVRQVNYIVQLGPRRYFIACTVMPFDKNKYDDAFDAFVDSMDVAKD